MTNFRNIAKNAKKKFKSKNPLNIVKSLQKLFSDEIAYFAHPKLNFIVRTGVVCSTVSSNRRNIMV